MDRGCQMNRPLPHASRTTWTPDVKVRTPSVPELLSGHSTVTRVFQGGPEIPNDAEIKTALRAFLSRRSCPRRIAFHAGKNETVVRVTAAARRCHKQSK